MNKYDTKPRYSSNKIPDSHFVLKEIPNLFYLFIYLYYLFILCSTKNVLLFNPIWLSRFIEKNKDQIS